MKKVIYEGLNTKCLMFDVTIYSHDSNYDESRMAKLLRWLLISKQMCGQQSYDDILVNMKPIFVENVGLNYFDNTPIWRQTCLFVYKVPANDRATIFDKFTRGRMSTLDATIFDTQAPEIAVCKIITGVAKLYSEILIQNCNGSTSDIIDWLMKLSIENEYANSKVIGFSAKNNRAKYLQIARGWYDSTPIYDMTVAIFDNIAESINEDKHWLWSCHITDGRNGRSIESGAFDNPLYAEIHGNSLVIYDNKKSFEEVKPKLFPTLYNKYDSITFNHYGVLGSKRNIQPLVAITVGYNHNLCRINSSVLNFYMINKEHISRVVSNLDDNENLGCTIYYTPNSKHTFQLSSMITPMLNNGARNHQYVLPYDKESKSHLEALDLLSNWFYATSGRTRLDIKNNYIYYCLLKHQEEAEDDIMSEWFKACTANAKSDEERLQQAYLNLKSNLIQEYRDIGVYLNNHNFNDKKPVPSIKLGRGLERSPEKKIAFSQKIYTIKEINNIKLNTPVSTKESYIKFLVPNHNKNHTEYMNGEVKLEDFYNKTTNSVTLDVYDMLQKSIERMR